MTTVMSYSIEAQRGADNVAQIIPTPCVTSRPNAHMALLYSI